MASPYSLRLATTTGDEDAVEVQIPEQLSSVRLFLARQLVELFAAASCPLGLIGRARTFADGCVRVPLDMPVARDRDPSVAPVSLQLVMLPLVRPPSSIAVGSISFIISS